LSSIGSIILVLILICLSAVFTALESALFNSNPIRLEAFAKKNIIYRWILRHKKMPESLISTIVIGNNFVNFLTSAVITNLAVIYANRYQYNSEVSVLVATVITTLLIVIFGETIPKNIGSILEEKSLLYTYPIFLPFYYILKPFAILLSRFSGLIMRLIGLKYTEKKMFESEEEVMSMIEIGRNEGIIESEEEKMIYSIFEFGDTIVKEIMTPRIDIIAIDVELPFEEALQTIINSGHSRFPVYEEKIDNIIGILHLKDLVRVIGQKGAVDIRKMLRAPYFVPESKRVDELFKEMQKNKIQIALVFDEFGGISGLVTIEDILEEIVGEIQDEFDVEEKQFQKIGENAYLVHGTLNIDDFNEIFNTQLTSEESSTIGGLLLEHFGRLPNPGEERQIGNIRFIISKVHKRRIWEIKVILLKERTGEDNE